MSKKNRLPAKLIEIENGTKRYMTLDKALRAVDDRRAIIVDGRVRFLLPIGEGDRYSDDTGNAIFIRRVKPSAGFSVLQYDRRYVTAPQ